MILELIQQQLLSVPEVAGWPELRQLVARPAVQRSTAVWEIPALVCRALGGTAEAALPSCSAIYCVLLSVHLVDDVLDADPRGLYRRIGAGAAANLALALEALGQRMLGASEVNPVVLSHLHQELATMALATAHGQHLDGQEVTSEEDYWRVVGAKTPPLFRAAFALGAAVGGAGVATRAGLADVGTLLGKIVQVSDDLGDAMDHSPSADWQRPGSNLAIFFALHTQHAERAELARLMGRVAGDRSNLERAQAILISCGAASYCAYQLIALARQARTCLAALGGLDVRPVQALMDEHMKPLVRLLDTAGVEAPELLLEV